MWRLPTDSPSLAHPELFGLEWMANQRFDMGFSCKSLEKPSWREILERLGKQKFCPALYTKAGSTLCSTGSNHCTTSLGLHANEEPVGTFSFGY